MLHGIDVFKGTEKKGVAGFVANDDRCCNKLFVCSHQCPVVFAIRSWIN